MTRRGVRVLWIRRKQLDVSTSNSVLLEMTSALEARGDRVKIVAGYRHHRPTGDRARNVLVVPSVGVPYAYHLCFTAAAPVVMARFIGAWGADVLLAEPMTMDVALAARLLSRRPRLPIVMDVRTLPVEARGVRSIVVPRAYSAGVGLGFRYASGLSVITQPLLDEILRRHGSPRNPRRVIWSSGVNLQVFSRSAVDLTQVETLRAQLGLRGKRVVMYHGALTLSRGLGELIAAVSALWDKGRSDVRLVIFGSGVDSDRVKRLAETVDSPAGVTVLNAVPYEEVPAYLALADVGVLPLPDTLAWRTSSPIKLFEYMAMGIPVVATDIAAHRLVLGAEPFVVYARDTSADALGRALETALMWADCDRRSRGARARECAESAFSWEAQSEKLSDFLRAVVSE